MTWPTRAETHVEYTGDLATDQAQRNAGDTARRLNGTPMAAGQRIGPVTFTAGQTQQLQHRLALPSNGTPLGWWCVDVVTGDGAFRRTAWDQNTISIRSANACTAYFWVHA